MDEIERKIDEQKREMVDTLMEKYGDRFGSTEEQESARAVLLNIKKASDLARVCTELMNKFDAESLAETDAYLVERFGDGWGE